MAHRIDRRRTVTALALVAASVVAFSVPATGSPPTTGSPPRLETPGNGKNGAKVFIVQLADVPVVAYKGGKAGYPATAPARGQHANPNSANVKKYQDLLNRGHNNVLRAVGVSSTAKLYDYTFSYNGFAVQLTPAQAAKLAVQPGVVAVTPEQIRQPMTDNTPIDLGLAGPGGLWATGGAGGTSMVGENVVIGVIDTGITPEHPSFSDEVDLGHDPANKDKNLAYGAPPADWFGKCESGEQFSQDDCNNKLIGARFFAKGNALAAGQHEDEYASPRDRDGHGTHTASTAGGNANVDPLIFGRDLGVGTISGMAPRARIAAYKGCYGETGCALSDLIAAIDTAVADGVDVINYSIGSDSPSALAADPDAVAFLFAADAGVFAAVSAGNAGPGEFTVGSPADAPWVTAVGASTHSRRFDNVVTLGNDDTYIGGSVTLGIADQTPLIDGGTLCANGPDPDGDGPEEGLPPEAEGAIVLCHRVTGIARISHGEGVLAAGGVGMILYDPPQVNVTPTDNHVLPTSTLFPDDGAAVAAYILAEGDNATASFTAGTRADDPTAPDMAVFSSRGPNGAANDIIKPDVTAPGVQILAANTTNPYLGAPGQSFMAIQGTSMSSPHVAGIGALLVGAHPDWTPAMVRSALTTTGSQDVDKEDGSTPADPFDFGGGHIAPVPANDPGLVYDAGFTEYLRFLCGNGDLNPNGATCTGFKNAGLSTDPSDLNQATIGIAQLAGIQTVTRKVTNVGAAGTYEVSWEAPPGVSVDVDPLSLTLATGESAEYTVTFTTQDDATFDEWTFGSLTWSDGTHDVRSPIAITPVALSAPHEVSGTGTSGELSYDVTFGYTGDFFANANGLQEAVVTTDTVVDDPASDINVALETQVGVNAHTITVAAGTLHLRIATFDENVDGATDDLDLYLFPPGVDPFDGGEFTELSGGATAAEQIDVENPAAGDWTLIVHGWETDGPEAIYDLFVWQVDPGNDGNIDVTAPASGTT
ncbi:MAG TPA: S8 family peptidase, partial [Ilumatobacteraceae bacterium]|nr:S8 family peptidase [Ilumatobacteraceae bacterium]